MTKTEKKKLHAILTSISRRLDKIDLKLDSLSAVEKLIYQRVTGIEKRLEKIDSKLSEVEKSVINLYLVAEETQRQQRASQPTLTVVGVKNGGTGRQKPPKSDR